MGPLAVRPRPAPVRDLTQAAANRGLGTPAADTLYEPLGLALDNNDNLVAADSLNDRITVYTSPLTTGKAASSILGGSGSISATTLMNPGSVAVDAVGNSIVTDYGRHRVLRYSAPIVTGKPATLVIGQPNLTTATSGTTATTLWQPNGVATDPAGGLLVGDQANHRVLYFRAPLYSGMAATAVFGQLGSFTAKLVNLGGQPSANSMANPSRVVIDFSRNVYVIDGNSRVLSFDQPLPFRVSLPSVRK
jgi:hypothetical protein